MVQVKNIYQKNSIISAFLHDSHSFLHELTPIYPGFLRSIPSAAKKIHFDSAPLSEISRRFIQYSVDVTPQSWFLNEITGRNTLDLEYTHQVIHAVLNTPP